MTLASLQAEAVRLLEPGGFRRSEAVPVADRLEKHQAWALAWPLWVKAGEDAKAGSGLRDVPDWTGEPLQGRRVFVQRRLKHIGAVIRLVRLAPSIDAAGGRAVVYADSRMLPLLRRSYPTVDARDEAEIAEAPPLDLSPDDLAAGLETLGAVLGAEAVATAARHPLQADAALAKRIADGLGAGPKIGLAWASTNPRKRPPAISDWRGLVERLSGRVLSLQYAPTAEDIAAFAAMTPGFIHDPSIDPLEDLDGHAAQIAAVDVVVTISNTTAHMAGALGKPCVVVLDDEPGLIWPYEGDRTAWYPSLRLVRRSHRPWDAIMAEAADVARALIR